MVEQPVYRLQLTYNRKDYEDYLRFYKSAIRKTTPMLVIYFAVALVMGIAVSYAVDNWIYLGLFVILGVAMCAYTIWYQRRIDDNIMKRELKGMPVVYRFYEDRMDVCPPSGDDYTVKYHELYTVYEVSTAFYIMVDKNTAAIIPKAKCPEGMEDFIRNLGNVKEDWAQFQGGVKP